MPAIKTASSSKRGAPKQKGAVRAKSGCYTCRIRRKKCDEQPDGSGRCMTCVRLRLECLGFGAKRPDWLRYFEIYAPHKESRNVADLREKIKSFLAAQGMIKGHSGTGPRGAEPEHPTLHLTDDYSSASDSPPTPTLSLTDPSRPLHITSNIRDDPYGMGGHEYGSSSNLYPADYRDYSPSSSQGSAHDSSPPYQLPPVVDTTLSVSPALASSFSDLYTFAFSDDLMSDDYTATYLARNPDPIIHSLFVEQIMQHYSDRVVKAQYLFAGSAIRNVICDVARSHLPSRSGASLLSSVHWQRFSNPKAIAFQSVETQRRLLEMQSLFNHQDYTSGDAMAALHVVSSYLFDGGCGDWERWLNVAYNYVDCIFEGFSNPSEALLKCGPKDVFIIKTSIWFDVLASVTTQKVPHFLNAIRIMFNPTQAKILELDAEDPSSMMSPMGCHNHVVWALAEASALRCWKHRQQVREALSVPLLVRQAAEIEEHLQPPVVTDYPTADVDGCRTLASEIFRASVRLYLRAVVSGDHPQVPDIKESVQDTIDCINRVNSPPGDSLVNGQTMSRSVVRNTVFGFFICGAFAEKQEHRHLIQTLLEREGEEPGNCDSIRVLLQDLWHKRDVARQTNGAEFRGVDWRHSLTATRILLV
ncbi:hypothetical protein DXG01_007154 [Tephrocybe rancida]|nr:hypothetical protein DXG01_007154 [Tephrocybe rancida]